MNISVKTLKSREKQCFDEGFEAGRGITAINTTMLAALYRVKVDWPSLTSATMREIDRAIASATGQQLTP